MVQYLNMSFFKPLKGQSYVELPKKIQLKQAIVNVKNKDDRRFLYAILAALHPQSKDAQRPGKYKEFENEIVGIT